MFGLSNGAIQSTPLMMRAFTVRCTEMEPEQMEELNRSVHTWLEESEHSGAHSDDGMSEPSAAGAAPASRAAFFRPDRSSPAVWRNALSV